MSHTVLAIVCYDCGHLSTEHRGKQWQARHQCVGDDDCECTRTQELIDRYAELAARDREAAMRRLGIALTAGLMLAIGSSLASILASNHMAEQNRRETNQAVCELLASDIEDVNGRIQGYRREPPATAAGQEQLRQAQKALERYRDRERALGCPQPKE